MLPFLRGVSAEQRVGRLQTALAFAASELTPEQQILYRHVFQEPKHKTVGSRHADAAVEISKRRGQFGEPISGGGARRMEEDHVIPVLVSTLLSPTFEKELDEQHPLPDRVEPIEPVYPEDAFELLSYDWESEIDEDDPRKRTDRRTMQFRMILPHQRVFGLRHYHERVPPTPVPGGVTLDDPDQTYLDTFPDPIVGTPQGWWMHFFHMGELKRPGEVVDMVTCERYVDDGEGEKRPYLSVIVRFDTLTTINLGIWVPTRFRDKVIAEAEVVSEPLTTERTVGKPWKLSVGDDGWVREEFTDCKKGMQYGIFLRDVNIYKK
jgi:hypothetical protein